MSTGYRGGMETAPYKKYVSRRGGFPWPPEKNTKPVDIVQGTVKLYLKTYLYGCG